MRRQLWLPALALVLTAALAPGRLSAQYYGNFRNSYYSGYSTGMNSGFMPGLYINNPYTGQSFSYNYTTRLALGADYVNPYTGIRNTFYYNSVLSGPFLPGVPLVSPYYPYTTPQISPYAVAGAYLSGGVGTFGVAAGNPAFNPVVQEQVRLLKAAGGQGNNNDIEARKMIADQWAFEQRAKKAPAAGAAAAQAATDEQILGGKAINDLAAAIRALDDKGAKANAPLLPADLVGRVSYAPGAAADVLELSKAGKIDFPEGLSGQHWTALRNDLQKAYAPVLELAAAGKRVSAAAGEKLAAEVKTARKELAAQAGAGTFLEASETTQFLNKLDSLAKLGTDPKLAGVYAPDWNTVGVSLTDYVRHLGKYSLAVGPRAAGNDEAYLALYRALADYSDAITAKK